MDEGKTLHAKWNNFKEGAGAEMIKQCNLKFNSGLGPLLETLDTKWGTADGQKVADKVKEIVKTYTKVLDNAAPLKLKGGMMAGDKRPAVKGPELQKKMGHEILTEVAKLADKHKVQAKAAGK